MKYLICLLLFSSVSGLTYGQTEVYKETKIMDFNTVVKSGAELNVHGVRADIKLRTWNKSSVEARVTVIAKHPDQKQALVDLEKVKVIFLEKNNKITLSNQIIIKNGADKPKSNIRLSIIINAPEGIEVDINNQFGAIDVSGDYQAVNIQSSFTPILLSGTKGNVDIRDNYSDISVEGLEGNITIKGERSSIVLSEIQGDVATDQLHGSLELQYALATKLVKIKGKYTPISIMDNSSMTSSLEVICKNCKINGTGIPPIIRGDSEYVNLGGGSARTFLSVTSELEDITLIIKE